MHTILEPSAAGLGNTSAYLMLTTAAAVAEDPTAFTAASRACGKRKFVLLETHHSTDLLPAIAEDDDEPTAKQSRTTSATKTAYTHLVQELCGDGSGSLGGDDTPSSSEDCEVSANGGSTIAYVLYDDSGVDGDMSMIGGHHHEDDGQSPQLDTSSAQRFNGYPRPVQQQQHPHNNSDHLHHDDHELTDLLDLDRRQLFFDAATTDDGAAEHHHHQPRVLVTLPNAANIGAASNNNTITSSTISTSTAATPTTDGDYFRCSAVVESIAAHQPPPATTVHSHRQTAAEDLEDRNLSWLFNFKLDELPHLSPEVTAATVGPAPPPLPPANRSQTSSARSGRRRSNSSQTSRADIRTKVDEIIKEATALEALEQQQQQQQNQTTGGTQHLSALHGASKDGAELMGGGTFQADQYTQLQTSGGGDDVVQLSPKKPPFTYTELIEYALEDKGELTVSGIYQWIFDRFPYYKSNDDRWKNSVRHNLSINPHFRKGSKAAQGAGHLWTISSRDSESNLLAWEHKKQRFELFFKMERIHQQQLRDQHQQHQQQQQQQQTYIIAEAHQPPTPTTPTSPSTPDYDPDPQQRHEIAMAVAHIPLDVAAAAQPPSFSSHSRSPIAVATSPAPHSTASTLLTHSPPSQAPSVSAGAFHFDALDADEALRRSAGEILNGVRRTVQVQVIGAGDIAGEQHQQQHQQQQQQHQHHQQQMHLFGAEETLLLDTDFLNPVPKEQVVHECGLRDSHHHYHHDEQQHSLHQQQEHQQHHHLQHIQHQLQMVDSCGGSSSSGSTHGALHDDQQQQQHQQPFFVTDIDPISLGVHMLDGSAHEQQQLSHHLHHHHQPHYHLHQQHHQHHHHSHHHGGAMVEDVEVLFGDEFNLNYFGYLTPGGGSSSSCSNLMT